MITRISLFLFSVIVSSAFATSEDIVQRHFDAKPGGKLVVDVDFGTVELHPGADNQVAIDARRLIDADDAQEKEFLAASPITITHNGDTLTIRSRSDRDWQWTGRHTRMDARYAVQLPKSFNAELNTRGGEIAVNELNGELKAKTSGGGLKFTRVHGPIDGDTSGGDVTLADCEGTLKVRTSGGRIESTGGNGSLDAHTSGGQVSIRSFAGKVNTATSGGRMDLRDVGGALEAKSSGGAIDATLTTVTDVKLETGAGAINVAVPANGGFNLDASSSIGHVYSDLPVDVQRKGDGALLGTINGGGKALFLRTSAGSISVKAAPTTTASR